MLKPTIDLIRKTHGRDLAASLQKHEASQQKQVDALLDADFHSGNFNTGGRPDSDSIPSDAFGDW
jgi:hypothetical protein